MSAAVDPILLEVVRHHLSAIAEEMSLTVMRSARSPVLREAGDLSSAVTDRAGDLVAQGQDIPMHMGVMSFTVREFLTHVAKQQLRPGDGWLLNLPSVGGNHLPDVKLIRPIFHDGRLRAFAVSLAHWADIGGAAPGSYYADARDAWQEGLRIPPTRIVTADGPDEEKIGLILANVRGPADRRGDLMAQIAATATAERRFGDLFRSHGADVVEAVLAALHDRAEAQMRAAIRGLPDGVYEGVDHLDDDGRGGPPAAIRVRVTIAGDTASFDFTATDDALEAPLNTTPFIAAASVYYAMKATLGPDIQPSAGCYRALRIRTRPGSLLDPGEAAPVVGGNHETCQRVADAVFLALARVVPERLTAGGPTTSGLVALSGVDEAGRWSSLYEPHGGGEGGRIDRDGMSAVRVHMANVMNTPAEVIEAEYPIDVLVQAIRRGSGGAGAHRGGDGQTRAYRTRVDGLVLTTMIERVVIPPYGLEGGEPGLPFRITLERADGTTVAVPGKANIRLRKGDVVILESSGGGGYGRPRGGG